MFAAVDDSPRECGQDGGGQPSFDRSEVLFDDSVAGVGYAEAEIAVVGEQEKPLRFAVQPTDRIKAGPLGGEEVEHGAALLFVLSGGDDVPRLVEGDVEFASRFDRPTFHGHDVMLGIDLAAEFDLDYAIDRDQTLSDQAFRRTPGGDAGFGQEFLKSNAQSEGRSQFDIGCRPDAVGGLRRLGPASGNRLRGLAWSFSDP